MAVAATRGGEREERESLGWITDRPSRGGGGGKEEAVGAFDLGRGRRQSVHPLSYNGVLSREQERDNTRQAKHARETMDKTSQPVR